MLSDKIGAMGLVFFLHIKIGKFLTHSFVIVTLSELSALAFEWPPLIRQSWKELNQTKVFAF